MSQPIVRQFIVNGRPVFVHLHPEATVSGEKLLDLALRAARALRQNEGSTRRA